MESTQSVPCMNGLIQNPLTGRWISATGATARRVFGQNSCVPYCGKRVPFTPQPHQSVVAEYFLNSQHQGILLYWPLGVGKTCGSILMLDLLLEEFPDIYTKVYILTPGSLRENFLSQYCTVCGQRNNNKFVFLTTNYSRIAEVIPSSEEMSNSIIIVDEMHTVINGYLNESPTYVTLYNTLLGVTGSRFILLSGTPISKGYMDMYYISKLLSPNMFPQPSDFSMYFEQNREEELKPLLQEIVSRVTIQEDSTDYPSVVIKAQPVMISGEQLRSYEDLKDWENSVIPPNERLKITNVLLYRDQKTRFYIAYSMIKSRQLCNMYYPDMYVSDLDLDIQYVNNLRIFAPKIYIILSMIKSRPGKHVVYSQFKTSHGINAIARILELEGISYLTFTGDMDDAARSNVTNLFNDLSNLRGENYKVLLMTEAAAQGQNFLHVRMQYILEQSIDELTIQQVIGRVNRFRSHSALEPHERNLTVMRFFATTQYARNMEEMQRYPTSDVDAYNIGQRRMDLVKRVTALLNSLQVVPSL